MSICGIYKIENLINGKVYIGQSIDIEKRHIGHRSELQNQKHSNRFLQRAWNKYGEINFIFKIIEECEELELDEKEIFYIDKYRESGKVYNMTDGGGGSRGNILTEETKNKISQSKKNPSIETRIKLSKAAKGRIHSEESKRKLSEILKGRIFSEETRLKLSETAKKRKHTDETKKKLSEINRNRPEEVIRKLSESHKGYVMPEEQKEKIRKSNIGKKHSNESIKKMSTAKKGKVFSEEHRKNLSNAHKGNKPTEEQKRRQSESLKEYWRNKKQGAII